MSISFADVGSTSGWLIATYWFKSQGIDPKTFFNYRDGASHPANELAVVNGQVDLATDYDRNRSSMIETGRFSTTSPVRPAKSTKSFSPAMQRQGHTGAA
jgi:ABC-type phosphate/phosphonate transport system substrate-binding protein